MKLLDMLSPKDKAILVTGGARGIGKVVARMLLEEGARIALMDIDEVGAAKTAAELHEQTGGQCVSLGCDVTDEAAVNRQVEAAARMLGRLDGVFNNAGVVLHKEALDVTPAEWQKVIDVNLTGVFFVARAAAKVFIAQGGGGAIVNTASMSGTIVNVPQPQASYNASKAAVMHLTRSLAVEWAGHGIRVNCISPGYMRTEMTSFVREDWQRQWLAATPFGRMGSPEELAGAVLYLLSDAASFTTGSEIIIDGGFTSI